MKSAPDLSSPVRALMTVLILAASAAPAAAVGEGRAEAVAAAADGRALEVLLERDSEARDLVAARAAALGLALVEVPVGSGAEKRVEVRVAGGARPFTDCDPAEGCPPMVVVPASPPGFMIGSPPDEAGRLESETQTAVSVPAFAIGTRPVTVAEYKACVAAGGCPPPEWLEPGGQHNIETGTSRYYASFGAHLTGADQPVVGVSHGDAVAFGKWLTRRTGHTYRLPSEAEWELAARAGTTTAYWWGDTLPADSAPRAACADCGSEWDMKALAPAEAFAPNPWGLYNVHGNVWEWAADFYCEDYGSGPKDGTPRLVDDCAPVGNRPPARGLHAMRGGSAFFPARSMRAATRLRNVPDFRNISVGFRVARDLVP